MAVKPTTRGSGFKALVGDRCRHARDDRTNDLRWVGALYPQLRREREPVGERRNRNVLHVVRLYEVPPVQGGTRASELHQGQRPTRRGADGELRRITRRMHDRDRIVGDRLREVDLLDGRLKLEQRLTVADRVELDALAPASRPREQQLALLGRVKVTQRDAHEKTVELGFRQWVRAFVFDWVLGGEDKERRREQTGLALERHLSFLHRLEQRRLGLRRRTSSEAR